MLSGITDFPVCSTPFDKSTISSSQYDFLLPQLLYFERSIFSPAFTSLGWSLVMPGIAISEDIIFSLPAGYITLSNESNGLALISMYSNLVFFDRSSVLSSFSPNSSVPSFVFFEMSTFFSLFLFKYRLKSSVFLERSIEAISLS